jgi:colanic acid/amylovoran biosynthesis glycosyltransferase
MKRTEPAILHLFENYLPYAQNWAFRMLYNLRSSRTFISALNYEHNQFRIPEFSFLEKPDYADLRLLMNEEEPEKGLLNKIFKRSVKNFRFSKYLSYLADAVKANQIDMIHAHFAHTAWYFLPLKKITGKPFIVSFYGFDYESLPFSFPKWLDRYKTLFSEADLFICEGNHGASILEKYGCPPQKILVVHLGIDFIKAPYFERVKQPGKLKLVQISNMAEKKGHIYTLQAFEKALRNCPDMTLTIVGGGNDALKNRLIDFCLQHDLLARVKFLEQIDSAGLYEFLKDFDVLIQPSTYAANRDCEGGAPVILLDAQATGMPVISTRHCDIPEEVLHGVTGLLSEERDTDDLANSIRTFYEMGNEEYKRFSQNARVHVKNHYDIKHTSQVMDELYALIKQMSSASEETADHPLASGLAMAMLSFKSSLRSVYDNQRIKSTIEKGNNIAAEVPIAPLIMDII